MFKTRVRRVIGFPMILSSKMATLRNASPRVAELLGVVDVWKPSEDQVVRSLAEGGLWASLDVRFAIVNSPKSKPRNAVLAKLRTSTALGLTPSTANPRKSANQDVVPLGDDDPQKPSWQMGTLLKMISSKRSAEKEHAPRR